MFPSNYVCTKQANLQCRCTTLCRFAVVTLSLEHKPALVVVQDNDLDSPEAVVSPSLERTSTLGVVQDNDLDSPEAAALAARAADLLARAHAAAVEDAANSNLTAASGEPPVLLCHHIELTHSTVLASPVANTHSTVLASSGRSRLGDGDGLA